MYFFPNFESIVLCLVLTVASWPAYRLLRRQVRWSGIPISWRIFHSLLWSTVKGFGIVIEAEVDAFLEFSCFFYDPMNVGNLISDSSAFYKSSLNIWKFSVHILLKPGLKNFEHYFVSVWDECNWIIGHWKLIQPLAHLLSPEAEGWDWMDWPSNHRLVPQATNPHP